MVSDIEKYGIHHEIVSGGIRNYVERLIETIKVGNKICSSMVFHLHFLL